MKGRAEGEFFHGLGSPLVPLLFLQIWVSVFFKYTAILASSPGGRGRKNFSFLQVLSENNPAGAA